MEGILRPRSYVKFSLVKATIKEIAFKSLKKTKSADLVQKSGNENLVFATQWYRKCLKYVPVGPEHP